MRQILVATFVALFVSACSCGPTPGTKASGPEAHSLDPVTPQADGTFLLDFGRVRAGAVYEKHVKFENQGRGTWNVTAAELGPTAPASLTAQVPTLPAAIDTGEFLDIPVKFEPVMPENLDTTLVIVGDDSVYPRITVHIIGVAEAPGIIACVKDASGQRTCDDQVAPANVLAEFGVHQLTDAPAQQTLILRNASALELHVHSMGPTTSTSPEFDVPSVTDQAIPSNSEIEFPISYKPVDGGWDIGQIEISSDDPSKPILHVDLHGGGKAPKICVKPTTLDFGEVVKDMPSLKDETFVSCGLEPLDITELSIVSGLSPNFSLPTVPTLPVTLQPGEKLTATVLYQPNAIAGDTGKLKVVSTDPFFSTGYVVLKGIGVKEPTCTLAINPTTLDFGNVPVNGFAEKVIYGANIGQKACNLTAITPPSAPFAIKSGPGLPLILSPNDTFSVTLRYTPTAAQADTGSITFTSDNAGGDVTVALKGNGKAPGPCEIQITPPSINFGATGVGTSIKQTLSVYNFGTEDCTLMSGGLGAGSAAAFSVTKSPMTPGAVSAGGKVDYEITFAPVSGGSFTGTFRVSVQDMSSFPPKSYSASATLSGAAGDPKVCITPAALDFGTMGPGSTATKSFNISSCGEGTVEVRGLFFDVGTSLDYSFASKPTVPFKIAAGASVTVSIAFAPQSATRELGRVMVLNNDPVNNTFAVPLMANGAGCFSSVLNCAPTSLTYPKTAVGLTSTLTFTCASLGNDAVDMTAIRLKTGTSSAFALSMNALPATLPPGKSVRIAVDYSPNFEQSDTGAVEILSNDCQFPLQTIALSASSFDPQYPPCIPPQVFSPQPRWEWDSPADASDSTSVWMTPAVANITDDNHDGRIDQDDDPDVIFISFQEKFVTNVNDASDTPPGVLRCIDGKTGLPWWTMSDPALGLDSEAQIAVADIDGDNKPEIIASLRVVGAGSGQMNMEGKYKTGRMVAFENDGSMKWVSDYWTRGSDQIEDGSAINVADLDGDGVPEIVIGYSVYDNNGHLLWQGKDGMGTDGHGVFSATVDLDGDGKQEIVAGNTAYRWDGTVMWKFGTTDGISLIVDVDNDGAPEVVLRTDAWTLYILDGVTGQQKRKITLPVGDADQICAAAISAADFDGDGAAELAVPVGSYFAMVNPRTGAIIWQQPIDDYSGQCGASGAAAFDFEGDGIYEAVYHDTKNVWAFRGNDGTVIYQTDRYSATIWENPVIADVDNDGHAEILVTQEFMLGGGAGLKLLSNATNDWVATRRIWNQWNYHVTNVSENATVPRVEPQGWKKFNAWRANQPLCKKP